MQSKRYAIGIDVSTQTVTAALVQVVEEDGVPCELILRDEWRASRRCAADLERRSPSIWVDAARECVRDLCHIAPETSRARGIGVSTTFPGVFTVDRSCSIDPRFTSLYDNNEDSSICAGEFEEALARAEDGTLNRAWPGSMLVGLIHLIRDCGLKLDDLAAVVPPNTAFAHALLSAADHKASPGTLGSDFTQTIIGGLYDARTASPLPAGVRRLLTLVTPEVDLNRLYDLLPQALPAWTNIISASTLAGVRALLGLPELDAISIGAGDSALGTLALRPQTESVLNVRGSSDTPVLVVDSLRPGTTPREVVLHYPMVTAYDIAEAEWCAAAPMMRSGRVWDWVKRLRFGDDDPNADIELERLAVEALQRRLAHGQPNALRFTTALGGERAPEWDPAATGSISVLVESHDIGDIALAALDGMSVRLRGCINLLESRYDRHVSRLVLAGGPTRNRLWNWITQKVTGVETWATAFADASVVGAALLGYASIYGGSESQALVSARLGRASKLCAQHPLVRPKRVEPPEAEFPM